MEYGHDVDLEASGLAPQSVADPKVSVIIPHYDDIVGLDICLKAMERQTLRRLDYEIIVADNNSPQGEAVIRAAIAGRAKLTIVEEKGAGAARNGGVRMARGEVLAFTDSDCVPEPDWLAEGTGALVSHDFVGGRMKVLVGHSDHMTPEEAFERLFAFRNDLYVKNKGFTVTANLFCTRALFEKVGDFISSGASEDCEWCYRARDAGYRIGYAENSVVGHPARRTWPELLKKWSRTNSELFELSVERTGGRAMWILRSFALIPSIILHIPKALFGAGVNKFAQRLAAITVLYRLRVWRFRDSIRLLVSRA